MSVAPLRPKDGSEDAQVGSRVGGRKVGRDLPTQRVFGPALDRDSVHRNAELPYELHNLERLVPVLLG